MVAWYACVCLSFFQDAEGYKWLFDGEDWVAKGDDGNHWICRDSDWLVKASNGKLYSVDSSGNFASNTHAPSDSTHLSSKTRQAAGSLSTHLPPITPAPPEPQPKRTKRKKKKREKDFISINAVLPQRPPANPRSVQVLQLAGGPHTHPHMQAHQKDAHAYGQCRCNSACHNCHTKSPQEIPGFFSRLFSRNSVESVEVEKPKLTGGPAILSQLTSPATHTHIHIDTHI